MNNLLFRLATLASGTATGPTAENTTWGWVTQVTEFLMMILIPILIIVATAGVIYAVVLGVKMAKAEDAGAREEAKKRIINFIIAFAITIALILLLRFVVIPNVPTWVGYKWDNATNQWVQNTTNLIGLL